jgi:hypothetical protein
MESNATFNHVEKGMQALIATCERPPTGYQLEWPTDSSLRSFLLLLIHYVLGQLG